MRELAGVGIEELKKLFAGWGEPAFRAGQVFDWVYKKNAREFARMTNLPAGLRQRLEKEFVVTGLAVQERRESRDGTIKLLLRCADGNFVEAVDIPAERRVTGCISSQAGCRYACSFCASGKAGFRRNLTPAEMCGEVISLKDNAGGRELSHIVFMGTGEPLDNYDNVLATIRLLNSPAAFGIGARRITISTCGLVPGIRRLAGEGLQIELSVSLHASDDSTRSRIMPVNRIHPLPALLAACKEYAETTGRQVTFEYILISGVNSDLRNAERLSRIVRGMNCKINLIPFNPVAGEAWAPPSLGETRSFRDHLLKAGVQATVRTARGRDIDAACGQLRLRYEKV